MMVKFLCVCVCWFEAWVTWQGVSFSRTALASPSSQRLQASGELYACLSHFSRVFPVLAPQPVAHISDIEDVLCVPAPWSSPIRIMRGKRKQFGAEPCGEENVGTAKASVVDNSEKPDAAPRFHALPYVSLVRRAHSFGAAKHLFSPAGARRVWYVCRMAMADRCTPCCGTASGKAPLPPSKAAHVFQSTLRCTVRGGCAPSSAPTFPAYPSPCVSFTRTSFVFAKGEGSSTFSSCRRARRPPPPPDTRTLQFLHAQSFEGRAAGVDEARAVFVDYFLVT